LIIGLSQINNFAVEKFQIGILQQREILALLALQRDNLKQNLDAQTVERQGFVSFVYDELTIVGMMEGAPQIVARDGDKLVGYALSTTREYGLGIALMQPLITLCDTLTYNDTPLSTSRYYIMGQVCIREGYRSIGIFDALYAGHKQYLSARYNYLITEVADDNKRSLAAHRRVGFKTIHEYFDKEGEKHWHVVLWDFK
jgi:GNAT superfamily N-acetyltransferase